jgi:hypothetical protein
MLRPNFRIEIICSSDMPTLATSELPSRRKQSMVDDALDERAGSLVVTLGVLKAIAFTGEIGEQPPNTRPCVSRCSLDWCCARRTSQRCRQAAHLALGVAGFGVGHTDRQELSDRTAYVTFYSME